MTSTTSQHLANIMLRHHSSPAALLGPRPNRGITCFAHFQPRHGLCRGHIQRSKIIQILIRRLFRPRKQAPKLTPSDDQDPFSESDKFSLTGIAFAAATKLLSSVGVVCAGPDIGSCAATNFQYHKNKVLNPTPLTRSRHLRRSSRRCRVFISRRSCHWSVFTSRRGSRHRVLARAIRWHRLLSNPALASSAQVTELSRPPKSSTSSSFAIYRNSTKYKYILKNGHAPAPSPG
jgi:hypothetical protein